METVKPPVESSGPQKKKSFALPVFGQKKVSKHPRWMKVRAPGGPVYEEMRALVKEQKLHTVCESATCPNIGECWSRRSLTIMILGNICTRSCGFCDVITGRPGVVDINEPIRVAETIAHLKLRHVVITSVDRDDLDDGGASIWAETVTRVREKSPGTTIEILVPDFKGVADDLDTVFESKPEILAHNLETVERLQKSVRPQARYTRSLQVLSRARAAGLRVKSGLMLGLGETYGEIEAALRDLSSAGCHMMTLGQYLRPSPKHLPVDRFVPPEEFDALKKYALSLGFSHVESGPLVRSSYHADEQAGRPNQRADIP